MSYKSLEEALRAAGSPVDMLRNAQTPPYIYPVIPPEYTNWRDEQRAWAESCVLFNQCYHMMECYVEGPDALSLFSEIGVNSFASFAPNKAKQLVACNHAGYVIGDGILFHLEPNRFCFVGRPPISNWLEYHVATGAYDVEFKRDERALERLARGLKPVHTMYRFQVQGPLAPQVIEKATGRAVPEIKFFNMGELRINGRNVRALRHGMVGQPGFELFGPWDEGDEVRAAILEAGRDFGIRAAGGRTYSSNTLESGWIPSPLPAVYTGAELESYRQWLPGDAYEAVTSIGGSFVSDRIEDYYMTPADLGYESLVKFDHDFIGRAALEGSAGEMRRKKMTLVWNPDDFERAYGGMVRGGNGAAPKYIDLPCAVYSTYPYDRVTNSGRTVGLSTWAGYSFNERAMLSLATIDAEEAVPGNELVLVWGEENGGTRKPTVERHEQIELRVTVAPAPYASAARDHYRRTNRELAHAHAAVAAR
jgi:glycine cleavage system aminomethyltransferase T